MTNLPCGPTGTPPWGLGLCRSPRTPRYSWRWSAPRPRYRAGPTCPPWRWCRSVPRTGRQPPAMPPGLRGRRSPGRWHWDSRHSRRHSRGRWAWPWRAWQVPPHSSPAGWHSPPGRRWGQSDLGHVTVMGCCAASTLYSARQRKVERQFVIKISNSVNWEILFPWWEKIN